LKQARYLLHSAHTPIWIDIFLDYLRNVAIIMY